MANYMFHMAISSILIIGADFAWMLLVASAEPFANPGRLAQFFDAPRV